MSILIPSMRPRTSFRLFIADSFLTSLFHTLACLSFQIHKVLKFLHSQQAPMARADDAESGCSESMSTSDSGRGNSVSEEVADGVTSAAGALRSHSCVTSPSQPKHVHFMTQDGVEVATGATNSLDRPIHKLKDIPLTSSSLRSFGHARTGARQMHFSTYKCSPTKG